MAEQDQSIVEDQGNNIVAQSEYEAALAAINATFDKFESSSRSHENENENLGYYLDQKLIEEIYKSARLLNSVKRVVRPIDDNDYSDYVDQFHIVLEEDSDNDDHPVEFDHEQNLKDEKVDEEEIDEEELVDMKALKAAQALRNRIRNMSNKVESVRERVLRRTEDRILFSNSSHLVDRPIRIDFDGDDNGDDDLGNNRSIASNIDAGANNEENEMENSTRSKTVLGNRTNDNGDSSVLQKSLKDLSKLLRDPQWTRLPYRIQSMQETMETIETETTEDRVISQTEIAITSKHNDIIDESSRRKILEDGLSKENLLPQDSATNAMDRLALFGQMFS